MPCVTFLFALKVTMDVTAALPMLSIEGETEHCEFNGAPEQLKATDPVSPPIDVNLIVYTAWWPDGIVCEDGVALIEKSPTLTCTDVAVELPEKFASPP